MAKEWSPKNCITVDVPTGFTYTCVHVPKPHGSNKPTVLFLHGFPSSSYDWHHQIEHFAGQGYGIVAPDLPGYGGTAGGNEADLEMYKFKTICDDLIAIISHCGVKTDSGEKIHVVGHDFGSFLLSTFVGYYPYLTLTCALLAVPYSPPGRKLDLDVMKEFTERELGFEFFGYRRFMIREDSWKVIDAHKESFFTVMYGSEEVWRYHFLPAGALEAWLEADRKAPLLDFVTPEYKRMRERIFDREGVSYRGPTNWYRARFGEFVGLDEELKDLGENRKIPCPTMYMMSEDSKLMPKEWAERTKLFADVYEQVDIRGAKTHWVQLEAPREVNRILDGFFEKFTI
jgi:pimeloyl-ACP methyl ester carboxylesterase